VRDKLNNNPVAQVGLVAILVLAVAFMVLSKSGGGESEAEESSGVVEVTATASTLETVTGMGELPTSVPAPPLPAAFTAAYDADKTVALLVVHNGGIDDAFTHLALEEVAAVEDVKAFVVPVKKISHYAAVTVALDVNRVPALIVMRPRRLSGGVPQASVDYGFQTPQSVVQAVRDASYKGPEGTYYPN
jgi:hypothetical protein